MAITNISANFFPMFFMKSNNTDQCRNKVCTNLHNLVSLNYTTQKMTVQTLFAVWTQYDFIRTCEWPMPILWSVLEVITLEEERRRSWNWQPRGSCSVLWNTNVKHHSLSMLKTINMPMKPIETLIHNCISKTKYTLFKSLLAYNEWAVTIDKVQVFQVFLVTWKHLPFSSRSNYNNKHFRALISIK